MASIFDDKMKQLAPMFEQSESFQMPGVIDDPQMLQMDEFSEEDPNPVHSGSTYGVPQDDEEMTEISDQEQIREMLIAQIQSQNEMSDRYQKKAQETNSNTEAMARKFRDGGY